MMTMTPDREAELNARVRDAVANGYGDVPLEDLDPVLADVPRPAE